MEVIDIIGIAFLWIATCIISWLIGYLTGSLDNFHDNQDK